MTFSITTLIHDNVRHHAGRHELSGVVETFNLRPQEQGVSFLTLSGATFGEQNLNGRVRVFLNRDFDIYESQGKIEIGSRISFTTTINVARVNDMNINNRIMYTANVNYSEIIVDGQSNSPRHAIKRYSENFLHRWLDPPNAGIIFSMLFGNRSMLDDEISDNFRIAGLTHILSVSGMHVGLIVGVMMLLLGLLKLPPKYKPYITFAIIAAILLFYLYLCDFRFSILRASIMWLVLLFNKIFIRRVDFLSSISAAAIITLILFPYALWSWSFHLSYACMFGIALFADPIDKALRRTLIPNAPRWIYKTQMFFIKGFKYHLCVTITTLPLVITYFNAVPIFGVITSLFFMPILLLAFKVAVIALLTWVGGSLLWLMNLPITAVRVWTNAVADIPFATIQVSHSGGLLMLAFFVGLLFCTRFIFLPPKYKFPIAGVLFAVYLIGFFV